jgi:hypothetical protein
VRMPIEEDWKDYCVNVALLRMLGAIEGIGETFGAGHAGPISRRGHDTRDRRSPPLEHVSTRCGQHEQQMRSAPSPQMGRGSPTELVAPLCIDLTESRSGSPSRRGDRSRIAIRRGRDAPHSRRLRGVMYDPA